MQIAVEIPEPLYLRLKEVAEQDGTTVEQTLVRQVEHAFGHPESANGPVITFDGPRGMPRIHSKQPGTLNIGPEGVNEYIFLP